MGRTRWAVLSLVLIASGLALGAAPVAAQADPGPVVDGTSGVGQRVIMRPYHPGEVATNATTSGTLTYHGSKVPTSPPKVYLVYWGSQWGTPSVDGQGYTHLTGDAAGMAPAQQKFFKGLGTNNELWSAVNTQYCKGIPTGSTSCPPGSAHVGYPTGGALAGVWVDNASAEPSAATPGQLAAEANAAAAHFGNTTAAMNANVQYVITSATGLHPDNFNNPLKFCAWHSWAPLTIGSADGPLMYTNMPYLTDVGGSCGANYVNGGPAGALDGVSIVGGHEFAETITDPINAWRNPVTNQENADECSWSLGVSANVVLSTGTFAVQSTWGNDANGGVGGCQLTHALTPAAPTAVSATPGNGQMTVKWTAGSENASVITGYQVRVTPNGSSPFVVNGTTATSLTVAGLTNGTSYTFEVAGTNAYGTGAFSTPSAAMSAGAPTAPTFQAAVPGNATAKVSWWPSNGNGSAITAYVITPYIGSTAQTPQTFNSTANSQTVTGLVNGTAYTFKIAAVNAVGTGPSSGATAVITVGAPAAPTNVSATGGSTQATVQWTAPAANATPIIGYVVTPYIGSVAQPTHTFNSTATTQAVTGLTSGSYTFKVAAINSTGTGPASAKSNAVAVT